MKKIHLIGNAHLDIVWLWQWQEGFAEIKATFRSALDRMKEFDDFNFVSACSSYYMWIEKSDPDMFEEIKQRVKEGRWSIVGGWYLQPDCNIPCGESYARHTLISQRYFEEKFGVRATTGYNVDSFGHNGNIPQMLQNGGMKNYVFLRPMPHEKDIPQSLFKWESMDGSQVNAYRIPIRYNTAIGEVDCFEKIENMGEPTDMMAFYGVGNHGGGATIELLDWMHKNLSDKYIYSTPDAYFESVKNEKLPIVTGDLQFHAKGCYSAHTGIKKDNRKSESDIIDLEKYSVLSEKLIKTQYPKAEIKRAWENILFNQFHDIMGGCSIKEAYDDASYLHGEAMAIAERNKNFALQQISWNIDTMDGKELKAYKNSTPLGACWRGEENIGTPIVIFNPLAHERTAVIATDSMPTVVKDSNGNSIPIQSVRASRTNGHGNNEDVAFAAKIPPYGYTTYRMFHDDEPQQFDNPFVCTENSIENEFIKIGFNLKSGEMVSFYDKKNGRELLKNATSTVLIDETHCDTWAHDIEEFRDVCDLAKSGTVKVTENGPVRATIRTTQTIGSSIVRRDYTILSASNEVVVKTKVDFHEKHKMLKFRLPVNVDTPDVLCEIPYGFIKRKNDGTEQPCGSWVSVSDGKGGIGVSNDSKYSFDVLDSELSMTIMRGAIYADHFGQRDEFCEYMDQGEHEFEYSVFPFESISKTKQKAEELNSKATAIVETFHKGSLKTEFSGVSVSEENIIVTAIKKQEDNKGIIIRLYETENRDTDVKIRIFDTEFDTHFPHNKIKTFFIDNEGNVSETDFIEGV